MSLIRTLNEDGAKKFGAFLEALRSDCFLEIPTLLLTDGNFSEPFEVDIEIDDVDFVSAYEIGVYLVEKLSPCEDRLISRNVGLWNWLALFYFHRLCKKKADGSRKVLEDAVYLLDARFSFRKYYRHAIRTPWLSCKEHGLRAKVLLILSGRGVRSDINEQLGAHQDIFSNKTVISAAYAMYFDSNAGKPKSGTGTKGGGSPRRLANLVRQFELTYDLRDCTTERFIDLLPKEFDRWVK